jgi:hypothetical protein
MTTFMMQMGSMLRFSMVRSAAGPRGDTMLQGSEGVG